MTVKTVSTGVYAQEQSSDVRLFISGHQLNPECENISNPAQVSVSAQGSEVLGQRAFSRMKRIFSFVDWKAILRFFLSVTEISSLFQYCPAIFCGLLAGLFFVNWLDGLNAGATVIVFILSICFCELIWQLLKRPHIILGACVGGVVILWLEDLNMGAEIIIFLSCIAFADLLHQVFRKAGKKLNMQ